MEEVEVVRFVGFLVLLAVMATFVPRTSSAVLATVLLNTRWELGLVFEIPTLETWSALIPTVVVLGIIGYFFFGEFFSFLRIIGKRKSILRSFREASDEIRDTLETT